MAFDPISSALDLGKMLIEKFIPDPAAKAAATQKLMEMQQNGDLAIIDGQNKINMVEAANTNWFIAGWRPFIGWICGAALAFQLAVAPMVMWGYQIGGHPVTLPVMQTELLTTLLVGMLGLGGMRTVEKLQGVSDKH